MTEILLRHYEPRELAEDGYPVVWQKIAFAVKDIAAWTCVRCAHAHDTNTGHVLTVHHLDGDKANCFWWNLAALCQRCHLHIQGTVKMEQGFMFEHSEWFKPYAAAYYAWTRLGHVLTPEQVQQRMHELLALA